MKNRIVVRFAVLATSLATLLLAGGAGWNRR